MYFLYYKIKIFYVFFILTLYNEFVSRFYSLKFILINICFMDKQENLYELDSILEVFNNIEEKK
jgi:hypothetical protein